MTARPLPWSLREKVCSLLRRHMARSPADEAMADFLTKELRHFVAIPGAGPLEDVVRHGISGVPFSKCLRALFAEMPNAKKVDFLVTRLSEQAGISWLPEPEDTPGPIDIPVKEVELIERRLDELRERSFARHDDEPQADEYGELLEELLDRLGRKYDALAVRLLKKRFPDPGGAGMTYTFFELFNREGMTSIEEIVNYVEKNLEINWEETSPEGPVTAKRPVMKADPNQPLPWSLREKLCARFRKVLLGGTITPSLSDHLMKEVSTLLELPVPEALDSVLRSGVDGTPLSSCFAEWLKDVPSKRRAEWLVDRLTERAHLTWAPEPEDAPGPLSLKPPAMGNLFREIDALRAKTDNCNNDTPDFDAYSGLLERYFDRLGRENEALAVRLLKRRYPDPSGVPHTFWSLLAKSPLASEETVDEDRFLDFVTKHLDLRWGVLKKPEKAPPPEPSKEIEPPREPKKYSPKEAFTKGDVVDHPKFGRGTVTAVEPGKAKIQFPEGDKTLVCAAK